jgi:hypothetical protein
MFRGGNHALLNFDAAFLMAHSTQRKLIRVKTRNMTRRVRTSRMKTGAWRAVIRQVGDPNCAGADTLPQSSAPSPQACQPLWPGRN